MSDTTINKLGYGPLQGVPLFTSRPTLSTTPVLFRPNSPAGNGVWPVLPGLPSGVKIKIVNGHATQFIAWTRVAFGAAAPTITADFVDATTGSIIGPGLPEFFSWTWDNGTVANNPGWDLYIVASAASTPVHVTFDIIT
jgi:hypothetical protein